MEEQLAAYRARKANERTVSAGFFGGGLFFRNSRKDAPQHHTEKDASRRVENNAVSVNSGDKRVDADGGKVTKEHENSADTRTNITPQSFSSQPYSTSSFDPYQFALKAIIWLALFGLFVCIGFGAIYVILSLFYIIYANLRGEGEKKPGEKSAYSVFNPNCERIHGTLTAEEIEKGMLYGIGGAMR